MGFRGVVVLSEALLVAGKEVDALVVMLVDDVVDDVVAVVETDNLVGVVEESGIFAVVETKDSVVVIAAEAIKARPLVST